MQNLALPRNPVSGIIYRGMNVETLKTGEWATFLQWKKIGRSVRKGEHGSRIVKMVEIERKDKRTGKRKSDLAPRGYVVFEKSQTELCEK